jgi:hypothetical protein
LRRGRNNQRPLGKKPFGRGKKNDNGNKIFSRRRRINRQDRMPRRRVGARKNFRGRRD